MTPELQQLLGTAAVVFAATSGIALITYAIGRFLQ